MNQISKNRYMTGMQQGGTNGCMVMRAPVGAGNRQAGQHSQCVESLLLPLPGIKIAVPSTPYDAKGMLKYSIRGNDPVVFLEHKKLYGVKGPVPEEDYVVPLGSADVKRTGTDLTIVATQSMVNKSLNVAAEMEKEGISIEVVDPRSIKPLDMKTILESVRKTKRVVLVNEAPETGNAMAEIGLRIVENAFADLKAAPVRVCGPDTPVPFSPAIEDLWIRSEKDISEGVRKALK
jgi:pyruvate dehydrogenase E1 component beta subunit